MFGKERKYPSASRYTFESARINYTVTSGVFNSIFFEDGFFLFYKRYPLSESPTFPKISTYFRAKSGPMRAKIARHVGSYVGPSTGPKARQV